MIIIPLPKRHESKPTRRAMTPRVHSFLRLLEWLQEAYPALFGFMNWSPVGMGPFRDLVRAELPVRPGDRVLDFGCGRGVFTDLFAPKDYFGIDIIPSFVLHSRGRHPSHPCAVMDGARLGFKEAWFDAIVVVGVLHHLDDTSAAEALREIRRVLKPGGRALILEPVPAVSRANVIGRMLKSMDLGGYIRDYGKWTEMVGAALPLAKRYQHRVGFNDICVLRGVR